MTKIVISTYESKPKKVSDPFLSKDGKWLNFKYIAKKKVDGKYIDYVSDPVFVDMDKLKKDVKLDKYDIDTLKIRLNDKNLVFKSEVSLIS